MKNTLDKFNLTGKTCVITGGGGFLGTQHARAVLDTGADVALLDVSADALRRVSGTLSDEYKSAIISAHVCDITDKISVETTHGEIIKTHGGVNVLINNAANNPKVEDGSGAWSRFENFDISAWNGDLAVGLTGAFLCSQVFGTHMALGGGGVIINISSDLGVIAPDQRIYGGSPKPVTYSVVKHGIIGLTKYLATYWADKSIRVNSICPGGISNGQPEDFVEKLTSLIPMERMANADEYKAAILFLASDASSYMTGANLIIDGGRTCW